MNANTPHPHDDGANDGSNADTDADAGALNVIDDYLDALLDDGNAHAVVTPLGAPPEVKPLVTAPPVAELMAEFDAQFAALAGVHANEQASPALVAPVGSIAPTTAGPAANIPAAPTAPGTAPMPPAPAFVLSPAPLPSARLVEAPAARSLAASPATQRWLRVAVGSASYAVELLCVQEVVRMAPIVAMRGAQRAVLGVMNLRGRIVPVFDLGLWLDCGCVHADERSRIVVVERNDELIGVLVTAVEDVVWLAADRIEPPLPGTLPGAIVGVARVATSPTVLLDANALFG